MTWVSVAEGEIARGDTGGRVRFVEMGPRRDDRELVEDEIRAGSQAREDVPFECENWDPVRRACRATAR